ncbi:MAG TPA: hypothetical protein VM754_12835, partial [Actinomycetota bacterium]|nr:hypothetical protein [Actinomycetota bacterium]
TQGGSGPCRRRKAGGTGGLGETQRHHEAGSGLFVARVEGESMNRRIPHGAHCVFRHPVPGSRNGKVVLVEYRDIIDPDV